MKKYKLLMIFLLILSCFSLNLVKADNVILFGKVIYLDAGHGGVDPGAVYAGVKEEDITLNIILKLKKLLEKEGAIVYLIRDSDMDLSDPNAKLRKRSDLLNRSIKINNSNCDLYLSIHLNADLNTKWSGPQIFYDQNNLENSKLAKDIQDAINTNLNTTRKSKEINNQYMYSRIKKTGVLIEAGFISNYKERNNLLNSDYQIKLVKTIIQGLKKYYYNK